MGVFTLYSVRSAVSPRLAAATEGLEQCSRLLGFQQGCLSAPAEVKESQSTAAVCTVQGSTNLYESKERFETNISCKRRKLNELKLLDLVLTEDCVQCFAENPASLT